MKLVYPELAAHLIQDTTSLCRLLRIDRADGTTVRLTDLDSNLFYRDDGVTQWLPNPALASPWWVLVNDALGVDLFPGITGNTSIWSLPPAAPWAASQNFYAYSAATAAYFLGSLVFTKDYVFDAAVGMHVDSALVTSGGLQVGMGNGTVWASTDQYIGFSVSRGSAWGNWLLRMGNGTTTTSIDSGVPLVDNARTALQVIVSADGLTVTWRINGVYAGQATTNIPTAALGISNLFTAPSATGLSYRVEGLKVTARTTRGGGTYQAQDGLTFSASEQKSDGSPNNVQVTGFLDVITEHDLRARRYDGATFQYRTVNWADTTQGDLKILSGTVGDVTMVNGKFQMELRGLTQKLTTMLGAKYGPICRAELFGGGAEGIDPSNHYKCRLNRADWVQTGTVVSSADPLTLVPSALLMVGSATPLVAAPAGWFDAGVLTFTSGVLSGFSFEVGTWDGVTLYLFGGAPMPFTPTAGDAFAIEPGCVKIIDVCTLKFRNAVNFAGEPNIPGLNVLSVVGRGQVQNR